RAELLLADRAAVWNARPEDRQLPSLVQWFQIRWLTQKKNWTLPRRKMMRKATRYHARQGLLSFVLLALVGWGVFEAHGRIKAQALRDRLLSARTDEVPTIVQEMAPYRRWINPLIEDAFNKPDPDGTPVEATRRRMLHTSLALLPVSHPVYPGDVDHQEYLFV